MLWRLSGTRGIRNTLFQAIRISATGFAEINIAIGIKIDIRIGPLRSYADAMGANISAPPGDFHKKIIIREQVAVIDCASAGLHSSFVYPILDIPNVSELLTSVLGIVDSYCR